MMLLLVFAGGTLSAVTKQRRARRLPSLPKPKVVKEAPKPTEFFATLCKTREKGTVYAEPSEGCSQAQKEFDCNVEDNFADPIDCKTFKTEKEQTAYLDQYPKRSGITCKIKATQTLVRSAVPDCAQNTRRTECPHSSFVALGCKDFGKNKKALNAYLEKPINKAIVKCLLPGGPAIDLPAVSCRKKVQEGACQKKVGMKALPISCTEVEG